MCLRAGHCHFLVFAPITHKFLYPRKPADVMMLSLMSEVACFGIASYCEGVAEKSAYTNVGSR